MLGRLPLALRLYLGLTARADPAVRRWLRRRLAEGKEHPDRLHERLGVPGRKRPGGALVWMHAASVGESLALLPLVERLREIRPDLRVLVTTGTTTSARLMADRLPATAIHQFAPVDTRRAVAAFLDHWRPDVAVWAESELWPRLILETHRRKVPMLLLNARMTQRSVGLWRQVRGSAAALLGCFDLALAQDAAAGRALQELGLPPARLKVTGTLKSTARPPDCDLRELERLRRAARARFVWLAASTHDGEEALAAEAHRQVRAEIADALLIVAPRHPDRGDQVEELLGAGPNLARRTRGDPVGAETGIYLADTLGEMGLWYRLAPVSFVGGSTAGIGGHNPYEPVALGSAVIHGPDVGNFAEVYAALDEAGGAVAVRTADALAAAVLRLSGDDARGEAADRARAAIKGDGDPLGLAESAILSRLRRGASAAG